MSIHDDTNDWRGNIVFFFSYGDDWLGKLCTRLVSWATHGPYVHCEIVYGQNVPDPITKKKLFPDAPESAWITIGAHSDGIHWGILPPHNGTNGQHNVWRMGSTRTINADPTPDNPKQIMPVEEERLLYALEWAKLHLNVRYGTLDIADQILDFLFPWNKVHLTEPDHFDCSNFAVAFLEKAGIRLPASFTYPFNVSPNDLAEWYGYLPERKRVTL